MKEKEWIELFNEHNSINLWEKVRGFSKNSIEYTLKSDDDNVLSIGTSKIGGLPDLPSHINWANLVWEVEYDPEDDEENLGSINTLGFLAQINLFEIANFDVEDILPKSGMIYFFYDLKQQPPYTDTQEDNFFRVIYSKTTSSLIRTECPEGVPVLNSYKLNFDTMISLPSYNNIELQNVMNNEENLIYRKLRHNDLISKNHILGYPDPIQIEYRFEQELDMLDNKSEENYSKWVCLLQLQSTEELYWGPAECGNLYFMISQEELSNFDFDKTVFAMQFT